MRALTAAIAALFLSAAAAAQQAPRYEIPEAAAETARTLAERGASSGLAWEIVESLTTEVGPRLAGSPAEARARDWAVQMFTELGFSNIRVEPFEIDYWTRGELSAEISAPFPQPLVATALGGSAATPQGGVEAGVAYFPNFEALARSPEDDSLRGRIVFIDDRTLVPTQTGAGYGPANFKRTLGWLEAQRRGAIGVVIRSVSSGAHRFPHTGIMSFPEGAGRPRIPAIAVSNADADQIARIVGAGHELRLRIRSTAGWRGRAESGNVIAEIPGRERPEEIVLIGAHLDSWDEGTGALDDGAGVAIAAAAARLIGQLPRAPRRTIRVVLFGAEEVGLLGARAYTDLHAGNMDNHIVATESDFGAGRIWRFDTRFGDRSLPAGDAIHEILAPWGVLRGGNQAGGGPDILFMRTQHNVPVVTLQQDGTDYFDYHHTPDDTLDKIDPEALRQNVAVYAAFTYLAAELDVDFRN